MEYGPPKTYLFLQTNQQTCTKCQTEITTDFEGTKSLVIIENLKKVLSRKLTKKLGMLH